MNKRRLLFGLGVLALFAGSVVVIVWGVQNKRKMAQAEYDTSSYRPYTADLSPMPLSLADQHETSPKNLSESNSSGGDLVTVGSKADAEKLLNDTDQSMNSLDSQDIE